VPPPIVRTSRDDHGAPRGIRLADTGDAHAKFSSAVTGLSSTDDSHLRDVLPPVSFDKDVTALAVDPAMLLPAGIGVRPPFPSARLPVVSSPIPAVVSVDPHKVASGCVTASFNHYAGRRDANEDFRC
jgi:hypothetical protein